VWFIGELEDDREGGQQGARHEQLRHVQQAQASHRRLDGPEQHGRADRARDEQEPVGPRVGRERQQGAEHERREQEQLDRSAVDDHAERGSAVVEHHDLVDHRELEVRVRVVERDAAVLGQQHDEPARDDQHHRTHVVDRRHGRIGQHADRL
jgi:hypothetical protein